MTASVAGEVLAGRQEEDDGSAPSRLVAAWQHPQTRLISAVGMLDVETERYRFRYLRRAMKTTDFRPFLGFRELERAYLSDELFPFFQQRVMNPRQVSL